MAKRQTDEEQNIKRKARRRLIGAIALTLAVVVVLPMVLDSKPKSTTEDIDLRIPDPDRAGEFIPSVAAPPGTLVPDATHADEPAASSVSSPPTETSVNQKTPQQVVPTPVAVSKTPADISKSTKPKAADKLVGVVAEGFIIQVGAYTNVAAAKQELAKLKKWGFKAHTEKSGDKIRVRIGPYTVRAKAEKVRQQLEKHGLQPVVMSDK